ncbi:aminotransferase class V-fold PLP-dependent enzyme [Cupriavidus sp. WGtm5]|uniref:aminotransferase class V-fold PLP-dependent enzyme n=1 Tax=Cupriavidus TaxID=106589 RepID=UPI000E10447C|nr:MULTISPECIES: aminotransferase class V-fold PLP-dependent enzyme [Cupriavidus]MCO4889804.1 aminotransferase class V-fold PLP-dependent enzyme [Cupriavidus sp. WGtm5]ULX51579.1 aminotransferase V [Cupriavidus taiwanensis]SPA42682.1 putative pyridoxal-phosphate-dependent aminotransferase; also contains a Selenocysteine lyase domain [Cupriavidus taiwanensis]
MDELKQKQRAAVATPPHPEDQATWTPKRREFLRMLAYGAGSLALAPLISACSDDAAAASSDLRSQLAQDEAFWTEVQGMFVLKPEKVYMNIGTGGSMPKVVLDVFGQENLAKAADSSSGYGNLADLRAAVAKGFGVDGDEVAFSGNTSSGMCHAILGIKWEPGDVVVTTNHEHGGGLTPLNIAVDRYGIEVSTIALPVGNNQTASTYVQLFDERIRALKGQGKRVRAMMWSSPTYKTGTMLPIADLMQVVKTHGLISIVDGAHLPGMMAYDYGALGMDFMSGAGHKWQCGPGSTGILVIRNKMRPSNPLPLPEWYPIHTSSYVRQARGTYDIAATVTSCGSLHVPMFRALARACEMWDTIGRKKIETYDLTLSSYLKEKIVERWGVESLYSPKDDPKLLSALTCFNPFRNRDDVMNQQKTTLFVNRMLSDFAPGFVIRSVNFDVIGAPAQHYGVRISTHLWHDANDIDRLVESMWTLSGAMA